jgi:T5SS/PEP-CTERM-associated repeat protein
VSGIGSTWKNTGGLLVGYNGIGQLDILNGGKVTSVRNSFGSGLGVVLGTSKGTVKVSGSGSIWTIIGEGLNVGDFGTGTLVIQNGGTVVDTEGQIGLRPGSSGTVTVSGTSPEGPSTWNNTDTLNVGGSGMGTLNIQSGGLVRVGTTGTGIVNIARFSGSTGTLNIGAGPGDSPVAPGTLNAGSVFFGGASTGSTGFGGTGTINFNHNAPDYVFAPTINGLGAVNVFAGRTILTADNRGGVPLELPPFLRPPFEPLVTPPFTGKTTIEGGTLAVGVPDSSDATVTAGSFALGKGDVSVVGGTLRTTSFFSGWQRARGLHRHAPDNQCRGQLYPRGRWNTGAWNRRNQG